MAQSTEGGLVMAEQEVWPPLIYVLEKALEQARKGEVTAVILLKSGPGIPRASDGYDAALGGGENDLVSLLAQTSHARINIESILEEIREDRAALTELKIRLEAEEKNAPNGSFLMGELRARIQELEARGATPLK